MVIGSEQCLFIILIITAVIGFGRGWVHEIITMAIVLAGVLFLSVGGDGFLHQFLFVNLPNALHDLIFGTSAVSAGSPTVSTPNPTLDQWVRVGTFGGIMGLAYFVGHVNGTDPTTAQHRLIGIVPGAISGVAMAYYVTHGLFPNNPNPVEIISPTNAITGLYLPIVLGLALIGLIIIVVVSALSNKG
jgi:hypothetical protein